MHHLRTGVWSALAVVAFGALAAGCGKSPEERATEAAIRAASGQDVEVERDGDTMTFRGADGTRATVSQGGNLALPSGFPDDVYRPTAHAVTSVIDVEGMQMVGMSTRAAPGDVVAEARATMERAGWKQVMAMEGEDGSMLAYEKDQRHATLSIVPQDGGGTVVNVQVAQRP
jgi:hypothetical protein